MTDELSIQQERKSGAVPGLIIGGGLGAAGGVAAAHYKNWGIAQKPSEEDLKKLFDQKPDDFNGKIERTKDDVKSFYETAKEQVKAVQDAEAEFARIEAEVKKNGAINIKELPVDNEARKAFEKAQSDYDNALNKLIEEEKSKLANGEGNAATRAKGWVEPKINPDTIADNEELYRQLHDKGVRGSKKGGSVAQAYKDAYKELKEARGEVDAQLQTIKNDRAAGVRNYDRKLINLIAPGSPAATVEELTEDQFNKLLNEDKKGLRKVISGIFGRNVSIEDVAKKLAEDEIVELDSSATTFEESVLKELGATEGKTPKGGRYRTFTVERIRANGEPYDVEFFMKEGQFEKAVNRYNKNIQQLRKERAGKIVSGYRTRISAAVQNRNMETNILNKIRELPKEQIKILEDAGLISRTGGKITAFNTGEVSSWASDAFVAAMTNPAMKDPDRTIADAAKKNADIARAKNELRKIYRSEQKKVERSLLNAYSGVPAFGTYDARVASAYENERLAKINKLFEERYGCTLPEGKSLIETAANSSASAEEIRTKAIEALKEKNPSLVEALEREKGKVNEELARLGKPVGELTGDDLAKALRERCGAATKDEFAKNAKDKALNLLKEKGEKVKIANKGWTALAAGAAVGLIGLAIGASNKNNG